MTRRPLLWLLLWLWPATAAADVACLADADVPTLLPGPACADVCVGENSVGVCVYYPPAFVQACAPMLGSSCYTADDGGCAIECLVGTRVLLYESWDEVLATRLAEVTTGDKHAYVNASLVRTLRGGPHGSLSLEASSSAPRFSVPETLLQDATAEATELSLKNIPMAITNASLPKLIVLELVNNSLTGYVPGNDSTPGLVGMTISNNNLPTMKVPQKLESLIWTNAGVRTLPPSLSTAANIRRLDLSDNPLRTIPARTFPKLIDISTLILRNCSLTKLPPDIEDKGSLSDFDISYNNLGRLNGSLLFSALGSRHTTVNLSYTNLMPLSLPASLKDEKWLIVNLDISGNDAIAATSFVQNLHDDWNKLSMRNCGLTKVPSIRSIRTSQTLDLRDNPIETLDFEAFDGFTVMLRNALVKTIPASMVNVTDWTIEDSALETLPAEFLYSSSIRTLALPGNHLTELPTDDTKEVAARDLILRDNRLRKVQLALGTTEILDISSNGLTSLSLSGGSELQTLLLKNNSLTTFPEAVFNMPKLQILDIRENPIRNLTFTTDELASLARIPLVLFDENQLLLASQTNCTRTVRLMQHVLCDPDGDGAAISQTPSPSADSASTASESTDTSSTRTIVIGVVVGVVVLLGIAAGFLLYRRRQQQPRASTDAIVTRPHDEKSLGILRHDEDLLRHRLDVNRLHIDKIIASGAFGEVFLASYLDQRVVVKRLKAEHSVDRAQFLAFVREIKLLAAFRFPNIVPFVGVVWTKEADLGVVTAFMPNGDLRAHLDATQRRSRRSSNARTSTDPTAWTVRKLRMALDVAEALVYLHSLDPPLVHRDLKSRNVLLDGEWRACLSDFGTSRAVPSELVTMTGGVGTALWMAPEVLRGERYDTACDVFSLGVILSEMDTHLMPYARVGTPSSEEAAAASRGSLASASANRSSSLMSSLRLSRSGREEASNKDVDTGATTSSVLMEVLNGTAVLQFLPTCPAPIRQLAERCASHDASERPNALVVAYELRQMLRFETEQSGRRA